MNTVLENVSSEWSTKYSDESALIKNKIGGALEGIEHIGSTSIPIKAKPIIDIAVLLESNDVADTFIQSLAEIGYVYDGEKSSSERHLFRKGNPIEFHLSLAYKDRGSFWERQILFRDYLRDHPEKAKEYEILKDNLLALDPTGKESYITNKSEFVEHVLNLARLKKF